MSILMSTFLANMPLNMVVFLAWPHLLQGHVDAAVRSVRASFWDSYTFALSIWPFVHPLSFKYVPLEHRLLVLNVCSLFVFSFGPMNSPTVQSKRSSNFLDISWMAGTGASALRPT